MSIFQNSRPLSGLSAFIRVHLRLKFGPSVPTISSRKIQGIETAAVGDGQSRNIHDEILLV
jgi:hypothetical protein